VSDKPSFFVVSLFADLVGGGVVSIGEFWQLQFWEATAILEGAMEWHNRRTQVIFEAARMSAFYAMLPHTKKNALKKFTDLIEFAWDKKAKSLDKVEIDKLFENIKKRDGNH
jgi:hypothetical protein